MLKRKNTRKPAILPMDVPLSERTLYARYIKPSLLPLLIVLLLLIGLSGCSSKASVIQTLPAPPANLAHPCKNLNDPPNPLADPERILWEKSIIEAFGDCKTKHRLVIEAWQEAIKTSQK
jgi:hypothetical protein